MVAQHALAPKPRGLNMGQALWHLIFLYLLPSVTVGVLAIVALIRRERKRGHALPFTLQVESVAADLDGWRAKLG